MAQRFDLHPHNPQERLVKQAVYRLQQGALAVYPTDSCYAFGCTLGNLRAVREIARIRQTDKGHNFTLVCRDLSEIAVYARIENSVYRFLKAHTPGPYTFILPATHDVPRKVQNPRYKTIGIRVPDHPVTKAILEELGEPIMSSTLILPDIDLPLNDPEDICERLEKSVDIIITSGSCGIEPTTVVDLTDSIPRLLRAGKGDTTDIR
ncbi:MAG: L-threonylcarbamoyladenylate synthase [Gammaproteobacteria bacterium]|jgi:tRNA threonylcarbamoyl adenosine modification protein (Sua5/YciO/YrdC/YwlC family)|nr:L-threonylcarbamoyladenylate synthase [Gammaproteobacteria bacterium]